MSVQIAGGRSCENTKRTSSTLHSTDASHKKVQANSEMDTICLWKEWKHQDYMCSALSCTLHRKSPVMNVGFNDKSSFISEAYLAHASHVDVGIKNMSKSRQKETATIHKPLTGYSQATPGSLPSKQILQPTGLSLSRAFRCEASELDTKQRSPSSRK